jgi:hypothetical protein
MKTHFYNRTPFSYVSTPVPECFLRLDAYFDLRLSALSEGELDTHPSVILAENLCRRLADTVYYATIIADVLRGNLGASNVFAKATLTGSLLVGHFSSCKSVLDASSIALARTYGIKMTNKEMDFAKPRFWKQLRNDQPEVYKRYDRFRPLIQEIVLWRDASVHRTTPMVVVAGPDDPAVKPETASVKMFLEPDVDVSTIVSRMHSAGAGDLWVEPHYLHVKWYDQLVELCCETCADIEARA